MSWVSIPHAEISQVLLSPFTTLPGSRLLVSSPVWLCFPANLPWLFCCPLPLFCSPSNLFFSCLLVPVGRLLPHSPLSRLLSLQAPGLLPSPVSPLPPQHKTWPRQCCVLFCFLGQNFLPPSPLPSSSVSTIVLCLLVLLSCARLCCSAPAHPFHLLLPSSLPGKATLIRTRTCTHTIMLFHLKKCDYLQELRQALASGLGTAVSPMPPSCGQPWHPSSPPGRPNSRLFTASLLPSPPGTAPQGPVC